MSRRGQPKVYRLRCEHCQRPTGEPVLHPQLSEAHRVPFKERCQQCERRAIATFQFPERYSPDPYTFRMCEHHMHVIDRLRALVEGDLP